MNEKEVVITKSEKGITLRITKGYLVKGHIFKFTEPKSLALAVLDILGVAGDYIVVLRKRRKE